jgi:hypothetical protein
MNEIMWLIVVPASAVLVIVVLWGLCWWLAYRPVPRDRVAEPARHGGADDGYAAELHRWNTGEHTELMSHDEYVAAGWAHADTSQVPVAGEIVDVVKVEPDPLVAPLRHLEEPSIFDGLKAAWPVDLDWQPAWASSYTQYLKILEPVYALPAGERDFTGSFAVVPA